MNERRWCVLAYKDGRGIMPPAKERKRKKNRKKRKKKRKKEGEAGKRYKMIRNLFFISSLDSFSSTRIAI